MNADQLLAQYEKVADAPEAIPSLRRFILDLAVRGKLVPQDPNDEPASELLERIAAEKARLVEAGEIKLRKIQARDRESDIQLLLPLGWVLTTLGEIAIKITDGAHKTPTYVESGIPFISVKDFSSGALDLTNTRFITPEEHQVLYNRCDPRRGDILLGRIGTLGKAVLVDTDVEFSLFVSVGLIRFDHNCIVPEYLRLLLNSPFVEAEFDQIKIGGGTHTNKLNLGDLHTVALPLPPLTEQHRIVTRVNELMALCDQLEAARRAREAARDRLTAASLARLNRPDPDEQAFRDHTNFALDNLTAITTRPDQIKQLRQTILSLAMRGKLVPQNPNDEPASELLKRISEETAQLVREKKIRKKAPIAPITPEESQFIIPTGWAWSRLGDMFQLVTDGAHHTPRYTDRGVPFLSVKDVSSGVISFADARYISAEQHIELCKRCRPEKGDILLTKVGTTGIAVPIKTDRPFSIFVSLALLKFSQQHLSQDYLCHLINSPFVKQQSAKNTQGIGNQNLVLRLINAFALPVPPLAEQHRIVAKVDELMALCDRLEASLDASATTRCRLLDALLHAALSPETRKREAA